jgi:hypothetical protein
VIELQIHPLAEAELASAAQFYEGRVSGLGETFLVEVGRCFERARHSPESGAQCYDRFRRLLLRRFPYSIVYEVLPRAVVIIAVAHLRRKPGYWRKRS